MDAASTYNLQIKVTGTDKRVYGAPTEQSGLDYSSVVCCDYNSTNTDDLELRKDGAELSTSGVSAPNEFTVLATGRVSECWAMPDNFEGASTNRDYEFYVDTDDTTAPGTDNVTCELFDVQGYLDDDTGEMAWGIEDEDHNDVGITTDLGMFFCVS
jgi:hypothetical protein